jgi:hypothetical protein
MIIASDGIWEFIDNEEAISIVARLAPPPSCMYFLAGILAYEMPVLVTQLKSWVQRMLGQVRGSTGGMRLPVRRGFQEVED